MKRIPQKREKPGPKEETLVISQDPETALGKLLSEKPPKKPPAPKRESDG